MARIRYLKPEFFDDYALCQLKPLARLLFAGLWCWADREGRLLDEPARIKKNVLGYDACNVNALLRDLEGVGMIHRYEVEGRRYLQIKHFLRHQRPHIKELPSTYPAPTQNGAGHLPSTNSGDGENARKGTEQEQEGNREQNGVPVLGAFRAVENLLGSLTEPVVNKIKAELEDTSDEWIVAAAEEAALSNGRSWNYVESILKRWKNDGFKAERGNHAASTRTDQGHPTAAGRSGQVRRKSDFD